MSYAFIFFRVQGFQGKRKNFCLYSLPVNLALLTFSFALSEWKKTANCCLSSNNYLFTFRPKVISNKTSVMFFNSAFCIFHSITLTDPPRLGSPPPAILGITV
jgi:hypothetical protein